MFGFLSKAWKVKCNIIVKMQSYFNFPYVLTNPDKLDRCTFGAVYILSLTIGDIMAWGSLAVAD